MYKIIFTDIDGTLLGPQRELTPFTIEQMLKVKDKMPLIMVSSRMPKQMHHLQEELEIIDNPLIAFNGAYVIKDNEVISSTEIPVSIIDQLVELNENAGEDSIHISLFNANDWYVDCMDYWAQREQRTTKTTPEVKTNREVVSLWKKENKGAHKIMCMGKKPHIDKVYAFLEANFSDSIHLYRSKDTYIEIASKEVSKLTGINAMLACCYPGIELENAIAFGDNYNDVEMIGAVGLGVAVENARDEVKQVAKAITTHHKEDGVAKYLQKLFK